LAALPSVGVQVEPVAAAQASSVVAPSSVVALAEEPSAVEALVARQVVASSAAQEAQP
tara:strand:+ start:203 stop:376 length:174 start_codon:yes stop_codon:yes gene_type:complete